MLEYHYENISYFAGGGTSNQLKTNQDRTNFSSSRLMRRWMPVSKGIDGIPRLSCFLFLPVRFVLDRKISILSVMPANLHILDSNPEAAL